MYLPSVVGSWGKAGLHPCLLFLEGVEGEVSRTLHSDFRQNPVRWAQPDGGGRLPAELGHGQAPCTHSGPAEEVASEFPWTASFISHSVSPLQQGPSGSRLPLLLSTSPLPAHFPVGESTEVSPALPSTSARACTPPMDSDHSLPTPPASGRLQVRYPGHTDLPAVWLGLCHFSSHEHSVESSASSFACHSRASIPDPMIRAFNIARPASLCF